MKITEKLLDDGDKIALSQRCRVRFYRPNAASATALLTVSGARLIRGDIAKVILMDREILIGSDAGCHIQVAGMEKRIVVVQKNQGLYCRCDGVITANGKRIDPNKPLPFKTTIEADGLSMVIAGFDK